MTKRRASLGRNLPRELLEGLPADLRKQIRAHLAYNHKALSKGRLTKKESKA